MLQSCTIKRGGKTQDSFCLIPDTLLTISEAIGKFLKADARVSDFAQHHNYHLYNYQVYFSQATTTIKD